MPGVVPSGYARLGLEDVSVTSSKLKTDGTWYQVYYAQGLVYNARVVLYLAPGVVYLVPGTPYLLRSILLLLCYMVYCSFNQLCDRKLHTIKRCCC